MDKEGFFRLVSTFSITEPVVKKDDFLLELPTGEVVSAKVTLDDEGSVQNVVDETGTKFVPLIWIAERLGRLSSLARAIQSTLNSGSPFVSPDGEYELNWSIEDFTNQGNAPVCDVLEKVCRTKNHWETHVLYLISNAGEGKTTILERVASLQAKDYIPGQGRVVVPISLSGKPFIRFEDLVIGTLANRYKFSSYFFPSFIAMVKLGLIIPAFDGFEEMFVESPSGEAISSMAEFIKELKGSGTILVAARSAYFEHQNLTTQGRFYDAVSSSPVVFSKIRIEKWRKTDFISYGLARALTELEADRLYNSISASFGENHPVLTRAVFVRKIFDSFEDSGSINDFLQIAFTSYNEFYKNFLNTIIEREASKWLLKSRSTATPVLTVHQHRLLLSLIAREMWTSRSELLRDDVIAMITDLFIEAENLSAEQASQVRKRITDHAVLKMTDGNKNYFEFDHQDFYQYFLGYSMLNSISEGKYDDIIDLGRKGRWAKTTLDSCIFGVVESGNRKSQLELLERLKVEQKASHARENVALLVLMINNSFCESIIIDNVAFDTEPFDAIKLCNTEFRDCIISSLRTSNLGVNVVFTNCKILEIELDGGSVGIGARLVGDTEISSLHDHDDDTVDYAPASILAKLTSKLGFSFQNISGQLFVKFEAKEVDDRLTTMEKVLRVFYNRIEVNEDTLRTRLSKRFGLFWDEMLPGLLGIVFEYVNYRGSGSQARLRIVCKFERIQEALKVAEGNYDLFVAEVQKKRRTK